MTYVRRFTALTAAALVVVVVGGCAHASSSPAGNGNPSRDSPEPSSTGQIIAPSTPPSHSQAVASEATALLRKYYEVRNELRTDPRQPLDRLGNVAIGKELTTERNLFASERKQGLHQVGTTRIAKLEVQAVNLDNSDPSVGKVPTVDVDVCYDVKGVDIIDKFGKSVVKPGRPNIRWIEYLVSNYQWATNPGHGWRVASSQNIERTPCAA